MRRPGILLLPIVAMAGLATVSCGSDGKDQVAQTPAATAERTAEASAAASETASTAIPASTPRTGAADELQGDLNVFAAASLTAVFTDLGNQFMAAHPGVKVTFNFGASSELVAQIGEGAPADVFASADTKNMTKLTDAGNAAGEPVRFATNVLTIIVGPGNPKGITAVADLANKDLIVVTCDPEVPCGKYATDLFSNAAVAVTPKSLEQNVKGVVGKVTAGEADAGVVYVTDVLAAKGKADSVAIPADINVIAKYPIAATKAAENPAAAQAFIDFVMSDAGQTSLAAYGFGAP